MTEASKRKKEKLKKNLWTRSLWSSCTLDAYANMFFCLISRILFREKNPDEIESQGRNLVRIKCTFLRIRDNLRVARAVRGVRFR